MKGEVVMVRIRLVRLPFLIPTWAGGQVLFPRTIFYTGQLSAPLLAHEIAHVYQIEELGLFQYWFAYLTDLILSGYNKNILEVEAEAAVKDHIGYAKYLIEKEVDGRWYQTVILW